MVQNTAKRRRWLTAVSVALVCLVVAVAVAASLVANLFPSDASLEERWQRFTAIAIFVASYLALAIGRVPGLSIDRAGIALVGAGLMVASGALSLEAATMTDYKQDKQQETTKHAYPPDDPFEAAASDPTMWAEIINILVGKRKGTPIH
jgi:disulfide bond formation protein DsbB